ncbi:uncharacterized protein LOC119679345 [Teleopsis dalmanni]|uniref:uncharacterized protein LOC119679345 n=1 Tax=Teleopsis dalmanni TaxID=139649 RepID=UPI0018CE01F8|nr:uncharacterized protein LOC119679345 [Teleopsis dalmanni]
MCAIKFKFNKFVTTLFICLFLITSKVQNSQQLSWANINEQVDMVIPTLINHFKDLELEYLNLPDIDDVIELDQKILSVPATLSLRNGILHSIDNITRYDNAFMTSAKHGFLVRFYLKINELKIDYDFSLSVLGINVEGTVVGSMEDAIIFTDLTLNIAQPQFKLNELRVINYGDLNIQLSGGNIISRLGDLVVRPLTNMFASRIVSQISSGLKDQVQKLMDDFVKNDLMNIFNYSRQLTKNLPG